VDPQGEPPVSLTLALAGQPNVGKSTVFNALTGMDQHVGNWPGKTVEKKTGHFMHGERRMEIVDLPGTYSLTAGSEEERIARDYLLNDPPDVVLVMVNAASLERNLYLVAELLMLPVPVVVGLNMVDVAEAHGLRVEAKVLEAALGLPVVELVASKRKGLRRLVNAASELAARPELFKPNRPVVREKHRPVLAEIERLLAGRTPPGHPADWVALKLLEGDCEVTAVVKREAPEAWQPIHGILAEHDDAYVDIAGWCARPSYGRAPGSPPSPTGWTGWPLIRSGGWWCSSPPWRCCSGSPTRWPARPRGVWAG
jgi:ferrous iron transport protein B